MDPPRAGKSSRRRSELGPDGFLSPVDGREDEGRDELLELLDGREDEGRPEEERGVEGRSDGGREFLRSSIMNSSLSIKCFINKITSREIKKGRS